MKSMTRRILLAAAVCGLVPATVVAQNFSATGTRAAGMAGAFVGVADDATAIYWNPAGLAAGSYFSLVLDRGAGKTVPDGAGGGGERSSYLISLTTPALGLGYYRLHARTARFPLTLAGAGQASTPTLSAPAEVRLDSLVTHHAGINVVQSLTEGVAVGATLKLVRGLASSQVVTAASVEEAFDTPEAELLGAASNQFDVDFGVMAYGGPLKVGLILRNLREPAFAATGGTTLKLERQARAGLSYAISSGWIAAVDADLTKSRDTFGERRDLAIGVEGRVVPRAYVRTGVRVNTIAGAGADGERAAAYAVGASYAVRAAVFLDGQFTAGSEHAGREWGIAARFVY